MLKSPRGHFVLVDGGGSYFDDVGAKKVLPYLHHRGIRHLDMIINTHPDIDHLQGLESVAREMDFDYLGIPASLQARSEYQDLKNSAAAAGGAVIALSSGQQIKLEQGLEIKVLYPEARAYAGSDFNQESVVLEIRYGDFSALLTGDIPTQTMLRVMRETDPPFTVVKVPHHGSKGSLSADFYRQLRPDYAVISVGEGNLFGHPAPAVVEVLEQNGTTILRTDRDGAVVVRSNGQSVVIKATKSTGK